MRTTTDGRRFGRAVLTAGAAALSLPSPAQPYYGAMNPAQMAEMQKENAARMAQMARVQKAAAAAGAALAKEMGPGPRTPLGKVIRGMDFTRTPDTALGARAKLAELARNPDLDLTPSSGGAGGGMGAMMQGMDSFGGIEEDPAMYAAMAQMAAQAMQGAQGGVVDIQALSGTAGTTTDGAPSAGMPGMPAQPDGAIRREAERFRLMVVAGDWAGVSAFLTEQAGEDALVSFNAALMAISRADQTTLPDEVLAISEAAPGKITDGQILALGAILQGATQRRSDPGPMLAVISRGTKWFGKTDETAGARTARLLIAADLVLEAAPYLAPLEAAMAARDARALNLHALALERLAQRPDAEDRVGALRRACEACREALRAGERTPSEPGAAAPVRSPAEPGAPAAPAASDPFGAIAALMAAGTTPSGEPKAAPGGADRKESIERAISLAALLPEEEGSAWLRSVFAEAPDAAWIAAAETGKTARALRAQMAPPEQRVDALVAARRVVEAILDAFPDDVDGWRPALNMLALAALDEADDTRSRRRNERMTYIPASQFMRGAPSARWVRELDRGLWFKLTESLATIAGAAGDSTLAMDLLSPLVACDADGAQRIAEGFLSAWTKSLRPQRGNEYDEDWMYQQMMMMSSGGYGGGYYGRGYGRAGQGLPLTRARQRRNLEELSGTLAALREAGFRPLPPPVVAGAFAACHSEAEVFLREDAERVLGPLDQMPPAMAASVAEAMRTMLGGVWRSQRTQQQAATKRSDPELAAEVVRGYDLALELAGGAAAREPGDWERVALGADLLFDKAEFLYGRKTDLATYVSLRTESFDRYARAAALYADALREGRTQADARVFARWFNAALGASETGALTRQDEPDASQMTRINGAIDGLGAEAAYKHRGLFAKQTAESTRQLAPELKPRFLRNAMLIAGDHPAGKEARDLLNLYDDLTREVRLVLTIDGPDEVGHASAFGARLSLRFTRAVARESGGGFQRYLMNGYWSQFSGQQVDYKDDFEKRIRATLGERFQVQTCLFADAKHEPGGAPEPGWMDLPIAYLVLSARDASVDRIPALQFDLDFADSAGYVVLPITSQATLIDARSAIPPVRPTAGMAVEATLDARDVGSGPIKLDVRATGEGVLPALDRLLDLDATGMRATSVVDHGLNITELKQDDGGFRAMAERSWSVELAPGEAGTTPASFTFPTARAEGVSLSRKRYADADIVDAPAVAPLGAPTAESPMLVAAAIGAGLAALAGAGILAWRRMRKSAPAPTPRFATPERVTPVGAVMLLRRIAAEAGGLDARAQADLAETIASIERAHFASAVGAPDLANGSLHATVIRWAHAANQ